MWGSGYWSGTFWATSYWPESGAVGAVVNNGNQYLPIIGAGCSTAFWILTGLMSGAI